MGGDVSRIYLIIYSAGTEHVVNAAPLALIPVSATNAVLPTGIAGEVAQPVTAYEAQGWAVGSVVEVATRIWTSDERA